jgi:hypothetical protein
MVPTSQDAVDDSEILRLANEEMWIGMVPMIKEHREEYMVYQQDIALVASQSRYTIPHRAIGNKLRDIYFLDSNNNVYEMTRINPSDLPSFQSNYASNRQLYFYIQNDEIVLIPDTPTNVTGSLRLLYYIRPNELVLENRVGLITAIDTVNKIITVDELPVAFTVTASYDLLKSKSPFIHHSIDQTVSAINTATNTITMVSDLPDNLAVGDYICLAEECFIPQIPLELHNVLAERVVARIMAALGDVQALQTSNAKIAEMEQKAGMLIDNRTEGAVMKVFAKNSPLRQGKRSRYRNTNGRF